jgi:hypothetical protein
MLPSKTRLRRVSPTSIRPPIIGSEGGVNMFEADTHLRDKAKGPAGARPSSMEGAGAYNRNSKLQAVGASLGLPLFAKAVEDIRLNGGDEPIVIADYGSSQGKNSLAPVGVAVKALRRRAGRERPICVFHVDLPSNDFSSLFEVAQSDPDSYILHEPNVFPCAIGRSFYRSVLPPGSVDVAWSSYAAHWLRSIPTYIPGHFAFFAATATYWLCSIIRPRKIGRCSSNCEHANCGREGDSSSFSRLVTTTAGLDSRNV